MILDKITSVTSESDAGIEAVEAPMTFQAFMIDEDDRYYYMGNLPQAIDRAVPKDRILYVQIIKPENPYDVILEGMDNPKNKNEVN